MTSKTVLSLIALGLVSSIALGAGQTDKQLQGKTIKNGAATLTLPTSTDTLVGRATTDTLTNKTISGSSNTLSNIPNSATTAASANTPSAIVARDGSGNFTAGTITGNLTGNASTATALAADPTDCSAGNMATTIAASGNLTCAQVTDSYIASGANIALTKLAQTSATNGQAIKWNGAQWAPGSVGGGMFEPGQNLISNNSFEGGVTGWTASAGAVSPESGNANVVPPGSFSLSWAATSSATLDSTAVSVTANGGLAGRNGAVSCAYKGGTGSLTHTISAVDNSGNTLGSNTFTTSTSGFVRASANFVFPSSGTVKLRTTGGGTEALYKEDCYLGLAEGFNLYQVAQARFFGAVTWPNTTNCQWSYTPGASGFSNFSADADCTSPTGANVEGSASAPATKIPAITFASMPPGRYRVYATGFFYRTVANADSIAFRFSDGTNATKPNALYASNTNDIAVPVLMGEFNYTTSQTNVTIQLQCSNGGGGSTNACTIWNGNEKGDLRISVDYFPSQAETGFRPDTVAWRVDANISGANPSLGSSSVASYTEITNGSLSLTNNTGGGVISAQIACASGTASTGTTCSSNESVGIAFNMPVAGDVKACASFTHQVDAGIAANSSIKSYFQIVETSNSSSTIVQEGKTRIGSGTYIVDAASRHLPNSPHRVCGTFTFSSAGQKTLRLVYEQNVSGTVTSSVLLADASATDGQRDIHWEVYPLNQQVPAPLLVGSVVNGSSNIDYHGFAQVTSTCSASPCTIAQKSDWISSITRSATGTYQLNATAGYCSTSLVCTGNVFDGSVVVRPVSAGLSTTAFPFKTQISSTGADTDGAFNLSCWCKR